LQKIKVLIIGIHYPEPTSTGAGLRMLQLLKLLTTTNFDLHFATASPKTEFSFDTSALGIKDHKIELNSPDLDLLLESINPQIVMFDRFITEEQFGWKVDELCPDALKILDTEDLHFLREKRELKVKGKLNTEEVLSDKAKRELAAMYRCDLSLIISKVEFDLLREKYNFPEAGMHYLPFLVERGAEQSITANRERNHFVSIGNFKHKPNYDMVVYTHKHIWPNIRTKLPKAEWHIYGAYLPPAIEQLHSPQKGILVKGRAEDAVKCLKAYKVMLAYLRYGAGLKQKCIDGMVAGTPIATSTIGAEGLAEPYDFAGVVEDSLQGFADKSVSLYTEESIWNEKQAKGFSILESSFSREFHAKKALDKIRYYLDNLTEMRSKNTIGQLLKHHMFKSTKYMSLWIQEKNRKG